MRHIRIYEISKAEAVYIVTDETLCQEREKKYETFVDFIES